MSASLARPFSLLRRVQALALTFILPASWSAVAQNTRTPASPDSLHGQEVVRPFRIIGNIYYVGLSDNASFLITTRQGHILLDPTFESAVPQVRKNIEQLGFKIRDVKIILNAHAHADHVEGLAAMKKLTGAKVLVMDGDAPVIADGGVSDFRGDGRRLWRPVRPDRILEDEEHVRLGDVTMVAHKTAGHTRGCTTWTTVMEENGRKYNVVLVCGLELNRGVPLIGNEKYPTIAEDYYRSFQLLKILPCDVFLASHTSVFSLHEKMELLERGREPSPFIDPEGYRSYLDAAYRAYQEAL